jgi:hypothetical protein
LLGTSRVVGGAFNHVAAADARFRFGQIYMLGGQIGGSWTRSWVPDETGTDSAGAPGARVPVALDDRAAHIGQVYFDRTARHWGYVVTLRDVPRDFVTETGFVRRTGITSLSAGNRVSWYGAPGALVEQVDFRQGAELLYTGREFWRGGEALEGGADALVQVEMRNFAAEVGVSRGFYTLDPADYEGYSLPSPTDGIDTGDVLVGPDARMSGLNGVSFELESSYFKWMDVGVEASFGATPLFAEGTRGREQSLEAAVALRPTASLRVDASLRRVLLFRASDDSRYSRALVPRLRAEYQVTRAIAVRALAQYAVEEVDVLRTPDGRPYLRDGQPFRVRRGNRPAWDAPQLNPLRLDLLLSWRPSPGTVAFLGYGREVTDDEAFRFDGLAPRTDGLFLKLSYLFRN